MFFGGIYDNVYHSSAHFQTGKSDFIHTRLSEMGRLEKLEKILSYHPLCYYMGFNL